MYIIYNPVISPHLITLIISLINIYLYIHSYDNRPVCMYVCIINKSLYIYQGSRDIEKDETDIQNSMEKVQAHEESFAQILKATQITNIKELVETFVTAEDRNFSLFNYVNTLTTQLEGYQEKIDKLNADISQYKGKGMSDNPNNPSITLLMIEPIDPYDNNNPIRNKSYVLSLCF